MKHHVEAIDHGEAGYLIKGELSQDEACRACVDAGFKDDYGDLLPMSAFTGLIYEPGWYRWNVAQPGGDCSRWIEDGTPGRQGSFAAVYLRRPT